MNNKTVNVASVISFSVLVFPPLVLFVLVLVIFFLLLFVVVVLFSILISPLTFGFYSTDVWTLHEGPREVRPGGSVQTQERGQVSTPRIQHVRYYISIVSRLPSHKKIKERGEETNCFTL